MTKRARKRPRECEDKKAQLIDLAYKALSDIPNTLPKEDSCDITGKKIACDLRQLEVNQKIIAEKLINDVLYYAKLNRLNENCSVNIAQIQPTYHSLTSMPSNVTQYYDSFNI